MKVVHILTGKEWRGGEQQALYLAEGLAKRGIKQKVCVQPESPAWEKAVALGLPVVDFPCGGEFDVGSFLRLRDLLKQEQADIVHAHDGHGVTAAAIGGWLAGKQVKRVCTRRVDFALRGKWKYSWCMDKVICISSAVRQVCLNGGVPEKKLALVYSGVNPDRFSKEKYDRPELLKELGLNKRQKIILNVASLTDHKGQKYLIEAMSIMARTRKDEVLLIAGTGELEDELRRIAAEMSVSEQVRFLGFRRDVGALLEACDIFAMSSHLEGLCTSALDAMAMERAVVVADAGGLPELVEQGVTGLVVPQRNAAALATAISELLDDYDRRCDMGKKARQRVVSKFSVESMIEGTLAQYRELLGQ